MIIRTTTILGAGAVLDFDFCGIDIPTTSNITRICIEQRVQGYNLDEIDLIKQIYNKVIDSAKSEYKKSHPNISNHIPLISFEDLFEVIETLYSYNRTWKHERHQTSHISTLIKSEISFESIEYYRSLIAIIKTIINIVNAYDTRFKENNRELWYKQFWKSFNGQIDVFSFNYDTTIEHSVEKYNDGFVNFTPQYKRFEPKALWNKNKNLATINHLHGCIMYADINPKSLEFNYSHRDLYKFYNIEKVLSMLGYQWLPHNQAGNDIFYTPIITGLKKTDKICYTPHNFYHANFINKIIENPSLLICGYSFGDIYANQILERHKLIHKKNQRVVIVEKWPNYVNENNNSLYNYYIKHTTNGFKEFVGRIIEGGISPFDIFCKFDQILDGCWQSPNGNFRLYTKGFKYSIEKYQKDIISFLQNRNS